MAFFNPAPDLLAEVADVGVALFDASCLMNEVLIGVGTCDGVVWEDENPGESYEQC